MWIMKNTHLLHGEDRYIPILNWSEEFSLWEVSKKSKPNRVRGIASTYQMTAWLFPSARNHSGEITSWPIPL